jgi:hypothetical protein
MSFVMVVGSLHCSKMCTKHPETQKSGYGTHSFLSSEASSAASYAREYGKGKQKLGCSVSHPATTWKKGVDPAKSLPRLSLDHENHL